MGRHHGPRTPKSDSTRAETSRDSRDPVRVYVALAMGTGTLATAHEVDPSVDPSQIELEEVTCMRSIDSRDAESVRPPSRIAQRVLEELSQYVRSDIAEGSLEEALAEVGVPLDEAQSLDIREAFEAALPRYLNGRVSQRDLDTVLENLEQALTDAHAPAIGRISVPSSEAPTLDDFELVDDDA